MMLQEMRIWRVRFRLKVIRDDFAKAIAEENVLENANAE